MKGISSFFRVFFFYRFHTLSAEYLGFTVDHSVVDRFQLKHAVLVKSHAKSAGAIWQESHFCQCMFMIKANQLIYTFVKSKTYLCILVITFSFPPIEYSIPKRQ